MSSNGEENNPEQSLNELELQGARIGYSPSPNAHKALRIWEENGKLIELGWQRIPPHQKSSKVHLYYPANRPSFRSKLITRSKEQDPDGLAWELRGDKYYPLPPKTGKVSY